jgi:hypothetical protein
VAAPATTSAAPEPAPSAPGQTDAAEDPAELERIVRAWSEALNAGDNEAAADLFAPGATVIQGGVAFSFPDRAAAVQWNASLPCSGTIVDIQVVDQVVIAVFSLGDRSTSPCDAAPGTLAAAAFLIEDGKITVWQQIPVPEEASPERAAAAGGAFRLAARRPDA